VKLKKNPHDPPSGHGLGETRNARRAANRGRLGERTGSDGKKMEGNGAGPPRQTKIGSKHPGGGGGETAHSTTINNMKRRAQRGLGEKGRRRKDIPDPVLGKRHRRKRETPGANREEGKRLPGGKSRKSEDPLQARLKQPTPAPRRRENLFCRGGTLRPCITEGRLRKTFRELRMNPRKGPKKRRRCRHRTSQGLLFSEERKKTS